VLGCGGTIARMADEGVAVHIAFLADGVGARGSLSGKAQSPLGERRAAAEKAGDILGAASVSFDDLPDNQLDSVPLLTVVQRVEALITQYRPGTVITHHAGDLNVDHRVVHEAVMTACRPQSGHPVRTLLCFEVPSSTEWQPPGSDIVFAPNWFVDITDTLQRKMSALESYAMEMRDWPHPRSMKGVEHLARWRGATVGCETAEAFVLARSIQ